MLTINNQPTQDKYVEALTLGPVASAQKVAYLVANNAAVVQLAGHSEDNTVQPWGPELLITPTTGEFQRIQGMRFKSAIAGAPAQVVAQLVEPGDPVPIGGTPFTASLSPSGTITPGNASVQVQKNGVLVGTEPILDFIDAAGFAWTLADDAPGTRILVTPQAFPAVPCCQAFSNAAQATATGAETAVALGAEAFDTDGMHDPAVNNSRITIKTAGVYQFSWGVEWSGSATPQSYAYLRKNGVTALGVLASWGVSAFFMGAMGAIAEKLAVNDYVELMAFQSSGGNVNVGAGRASFISAVRVAAG